MALALSGIIGYYGRSTVITWEDCQSIEQVRASALNAKGYSVGIPRLQIYDVKERGGMGMEHAYTYAAAALIAIVISPAMDMPNPQNEYASPYALVSGA